MTSFIVPAPTPAQAEPAITAGTFWPDVSPGTVREENGIDGTVTPARLKSVISEALAAMDDELKVWRQTQEAAGYPSLDAIPSLQIGEKTALEHRFHRALGCLVKAMVLERYRGFDATAAGDKKADAQENPIDDLRRDYRWAIADLQGQQRTVVELI